jgi:hypothetical protein
MPNTSCTSGPQLPSQDKHHPYSNTHKPSCNPLPYLEAHKHHLLCGCGLWPLNMPDVCLFCNIPSMLLWVGRQRVSCDPLLAGHTAYQG